MSKRPPFWGDWYYWTAQVTVSLLLASFFGAVGGSWILGGICFVWIFGILIWLDHRYWKAGKPVSHGPFTWGQEKTKATLDQLEKEFPNGTELVFEVYENRQRGTVLGYVHSLPLVPGEEDEPALVVLTQKGTPGHVYPHEVIRAKSPNGEVKSY